MTPETFQKNQPKVMRSWAFYDWANSVYSLVISSTIFPIFWSIISTADGNDRVIFLGGSFNNDSLVTYVTSLGFLVIVLLSPILSGIADYTGRKKFFLRFFCYLGAFSCFGLYWMSIDNLGFGLLLYFLALLGFWCSLVFYNSYLPDIATPEEQDKLSARGFAFGFLGSTILLVINLWMVMTQVHEDVALQKEMRLQMMRYSFITVGVWWIVFGYLSSKSLPNFKNSNKVNKTVLLNGYKELRNIWKQLNQNIILKRFLGAFFSYSMAVQTIMIIATYFGVEEIEWGETDSSTGLIVSILLINLIAIPGALGTSLIAKSIGNLKALVLVNTIWFCVCIYAYTIHSPTEFYITAAFVGLVMGGVQSLSRSTYSKLLPLDTSDTTSFFSFYDVTEKIGIIIGTLMYGVLGDLTGSPRYAIVFFGLFFLVGVILLYRLIKTPRLQ